MSSWSRCVKVTVDSQLVGKNHRKGVFGQGEPAIRIPIDEGFGISDVIVIIERKRRTKDLAQGGSGGNTATLWNMH
jgi:hypothetical protein